ncbi:MAG TPA: hypothetical protein DCG47_08030 [Spirochaetaceae bacterium]|jgi:hypothetical protein|nr:hypothetical protein [Spirochaetaceae bacterium]
MPDVNVEENLKQADYLLTTPDGSYKPKTKREMEEIRALLDAASGALETGDQRRMHETVKAKYDFLMQKSWHVSGSTLAWAVVFAILFFFGARVDPGAATPATIAGIWLVLGIVVYGVSCYYPNFFATKETNTPLNPFAGEGNEPISKTDLRIAARKASGKPTDLSDGIEVGKGISKFIFGLLKSFILPFIGIANFIRYWR